VQLITREKGRGCPKGGGGFLSIPVDLFLSLIAMRERVGELLVGHLHFAFNMKNSQK